MLTWDFLRQDRKARKDRELLASRSLRACMLFQSTQHGWGKGVSRMGAIQLAWRIGNQDIYQPKKCSWNHAEAQRR